MVKSKKFLIALIFAVSACSNKGPHKPLPTSGGESTPSPAGRETAIPFASVKPIFAANCYGCHNWQNDEAAATKAAKEGKIQLFVSKKIMPKQGSPQADKISQADRDKIVAWAKSVANSSSVASKDGTADTNSPSSDTIKDRNLSFASRCMRCHGPQGTSAMPDIPNLASHSHDYIVARLLEFLQPGARGTLMPGQMMVLKNEFNLKDEKDSDTMALLDYVADFYGKYDLSATAESLATRRDSLKPDEKALYETGKKIVSENQCTSCHLIAPALRPMDGMPMIFAQKRAYLDSRLSDFKNKLAGNVMPGILEGLDEKDLPAISLYLSLTHPNEAPAATP